MSHDSSIEPILRAVEPALRLVSERHLRQVLNFLADRGRALPTRADLPHWFSRTDLVAADVLPRAVLEGTEPRLLLVTDPNDRLIDSKPREEQLRVYWRVLFRAAVMRAIDQQLASGKLSPETCSARLSTFGPGAAREIRYVLENEHFAAPEANDVDRYRVFSAVYLDLDHFTTHAAEEFFPALPHGHAVRDLLSDGIPLAELATGSRPAGAADPERDPPPDERWCAPCAPRTPASGAAARGDTSGKLQKALEAEQKGNLVRAAVLRTQAAEIGQGEDCERAVAGAIAALGQLVDRLGDVLEWDHETRQEWRQALGPLLPLAAAGIWPRAARCLYELQRIPADLAREVYAVDLPEAIRTLGRRPVRRHLPHARPVMLLMALNKAHKQLLRAGLDEQEQLRLDRLMHHEVHRREHAIRHEFEPIIVRAITDAGVVPANRVEEVARDKLVAELLDRVCDRGFLRIGDLRDAVARNRLKLPDLAGVGEFLTGDPLLRADRNLAYALDGVYRRGEIYLRMIQRFSSIFFGTPWGRALTLYLLLPFGGAFFALMFAEELRHIGGNVVGLVSRSFESKPKAQATPGTMVPVPNGGTAPAAQWEWDFDEDTLEFFEDEVATPTDFDPDTLEFVTKNVEDRVELVTNVFTSSAPKKGAVWEFDENTLEFHEVVPHGHGTDLITWPAILGLGIILLLMFHAPPFRRSVLAGMGVVWWAVRGVVWDLPHAVWRSRSLRAIRLSGTARFLYRHFFSPLLLSLILVGVFFVLGLSPRFLLWWGWILFVTLTVFYNTPFGWMFQDRIAEALSDWWRLVRSNLVPGLIGTIIDVFRTLANWVERQLYAVDEWMRFRGGDSQGSLALKALLGLIWFPIAYVTRFAFYLLLEPQVNPVKHFPVVTVGHKVVWPTLPALAEIIGWVPATVIINGCPGVFGFVAWELKENWRLYRANRSPDLKPVMLGSHGESMRGLLRPGFHSGTVPKLHRKTRRALDAGDRAQAARLHHELQHAAEGVHRFIERELLPLLAGNKDWGGIAVEVGAVRFGCQRAEVELRAPALGRDPFVIAFENIGGTIEASIPHMGWADKLTESQRAASTFALRGLLDMAAAARFDARERTAEPGPEQGAGALARRVTWAEWVARW